MCMISLPATACSSQDTQLWLRQQSSPHTSSDAAVCPEDTNTTSLRPKAIFSNKTLTQKLPCLSLCSSPSCLRRSRFGAEKEGAPLCKPMKVRIAHSVRLGFSQFLGDIAICAWRPTVRFILFVSVWNCVVNVARGSAARIV